MAQRQKAHALVGFHLLQADTSLPHAADKSVVALHGPFGSTGRAGGIDQYGELLWSAGLHAFLHSLGMLRQIGSPQVTQCFEGNHARIVKVAQPFHVKHHDLAQLGQIRTNLQRFVQLLLVFDKQNDGAGILTKVMDLAGRIGGINAIGDTAATQDCNVRQHPFDQGV